MSFGAPLGLLALLALPALIAIHLFRRRFRPRPTTGLFLWGDARLAPAAGRRRQRLVWRASLLFELLAALALTWFLSDPHLGHRERARHLIVVLDDRARLQATLPDGSQVADVLRAALSVRLRALDRDDRVTLITSGRPARILAGPAASAPEAAELLDRWRPAAPMHALDDAIGLAVDLATEGVGAQQTANLLVVSDRAPLGLADTAGVFTRGLARPAGGLVDARWIRAADGERLAVRAVAHGGPAVRTLVVRAGDRELARRALSLGPEEAQTVVLPLPADPPDSLSVALLGEDPVAVDDQATLVRPPSRQVRVAIAVPPEVAGPVRRALMAVVGVTLVTDADAADLVVLGAHTPAPAGDDAWTLRLAPGAGAVVVGPFLAARGNALLRGVDFTGVIWVGAPAAGEGEDPGNALTVGEDPGNALTVGEDPGDSLLVAGEAGLVAETWRGRTRHVVVHVDLTRSNLVDHPAWPGLVANLVAARRDALPGPLRTNVPLGQEARVTLPVGRDTLRLVPPDGGVPLDLAADARGEVLIPPLDRPGVYGLELGPDPAADPAAPAPAAAGPWGRMNALLVGPELSDLSGATSLDVAPADLGEGDVERRRGPAAHLIPLLVALLAGLAAWVAFRREERGAAEALAPQPAGGTR